MWAIALFSLRINRYVLTSRAQRVYSNAENDFSHKDNYGAGSVSKLDINDGAWPILLTGFNAEDRLDLSAIGALLDFYRQLRLPGVLALGQASEVLHLNDAERFAIAEAVARHERGSLAAAIVGNFGETIAQQARSLQRIHDMGADAVVVALALLPSEDGLGEQLIELCDLVGADVRLGIYEIPQPEHRLLSPREVSQVAKTGRYVFMKDTCRQMQPFSAKLAAADRTRLKLFQANLQVLPPSMDAGSSGFCGWMPIVAPELCAQVCDMRLPAGLRRLAHEKLTEFNDVMVAHGFPASAKHILARRGIPIQPFSREPAAKTFFSSDSHELDAYIDAASPFHPLPLPEKA